MARNRYREMERIMTFAILGDAALFILFLIMAGAGIIWLKVILAILTLLLSGVILAQLYFSRELMKRRSLWMTTAAAAVILCTVFALVLNFPSPRYQLPEAGSTTQQSK